MKKIKKLFVFLCISLFCLINPRSNILALDLSSYENMKFVSYINSDYNSFIRIPKVKHKVIQEPKNVIAETKATSNTTATDEIVSIDTTDDTISIDTTSTDDTVSTEPIDTTSADDTLSTTDTAPVDNTKYIALTFDDGPNASFTPKLIEALNIHDAKATFFLIGNMIPNNTDIVKMIYDSGNEIGNHTYNHFQLPYLSSYEIDSELKQTSDLIRSITGADPTLMRPPYGAHDGVCDEIAMAYNMPVIMWNVDTEDWKHRDVDIVYNHIVDNLEDGNIILLHDIHGTSVDAAIKILENYSNKGYKFVTVSELAAIKGTSLIPGQTYYNIQ